MSESLFSPEVDDHHGIYHGKYYSTVLYPLENYSSLVVTGGSTITFQAPGEQVWNPSKGYTSFNIQITSTNATVYYPWLRAGCIPFFDRFIWNVGGTQSSTEAYNHFSKMAMPYCKSFAEMQTRDPSNIFIQSQSAKSSNLNCNGFNDPNSYSLQQMIELTNGAGIASGTNGGIVNFTVNVLNEDMIGTGLTINDDLCLGANLQFQYTLAAIDKWLSFSTSNNNPTTGCLSASGIATITVQLTNISHSLALETNPIAIAAAKDRQKRGFEIPIPKAFRMYASQLNGASQVVNPPLITKGSSGIVERIFTAPFNGTEAINPTPPNGTLVLGNYSLDNSNVTVSTLDTTYAGLKVQSIQSILDGSPLTYKQLQCSPIVQYGFGAKSSGCPEDFMKMFDYYSTSCIQNAGALGSGFVWIDEFTDQNPRLKKFNRWEKLEDGRDFGNGVNYQVLATCGTSGYTCGPNVSGICYITWYMFSMGWQKMSCINGNINIYS